MVDLVCPVCGRKSRGVCLDCFLEKKPVEFRDISLAFCKCGRVRHRGHWGELSKEMVADLLKHSVMAPRDLVLEKLKAGVNPDGSFHAVLDLVYDGGKFTREFDVPVSRSSTTCLVCSRKSASYYEAVLQVRGKMVDFYMDTDYLMKAEKVRGGADYYMMSTNYAKQKARELAEKGYYVKESSKLVGQKDGLDLYRVYISVKHPDFNAGDVIEHKRRLYLVRELGRWVKLTEVDSGKGTAYPLNQLKEADVAVPKSEVRKALVTQVRPDGVQVMDLSDYMNYEIPKGKGLKQGDEVEIALISGRAHIL